MKLIDKMIETINKYEDMNDDDFKELIRYKGKEVVYQSIPCPVCQENEVIKKHLMKDRSYLIDGEFQLYKCNNCKLEFIYPLPSDKELAKYYPEKYYSYHKKRWLQRFYHNISAYYSKSKNILLRPISSLLQRYYLEGKSILEIGCGSGFSLEIYQKYGIKTAGIEPYGEYNDKLGILDADIKHIEFIEKFDYIILNNVIEHISNPEFVIEKCYYWLSDTGYLIINSPNTDSWWRRLFGKYWSGYDVPRHLYNYNPDNLSSLLIKKGFKIESVRIYDVPYMIRLSLKFITGLNLRILDIIFIPLSLIATFVEEGSMMEIKVRKDEQ